jgi:hypothetical protein
MKMSLKFSFILLVSVTLIGFQSCQKEIGNDSLNTQNDNSPVLKSATMNTFYSPTLPIGGGVARAWIKVNKSGDPLEAGINLSAKALTNLPAEMQQYVFVLPAKKGKNFYNHVLLDWNPHGHEPAGIYDLPHFDFHFYTISNEDRLAIPPANPPYMDPAPAAKYIPANYFELPGLVPAMGAHWANATSPELPPTLQKFTHTFIWGSYSGKFIFWEPMITLEYLLTHPDNIFPVSQPEAFQSDGWYPTDYKVSYSTQPGEYTISLLNLTHHNAE